MPHLPDSNNSGPDLLSFGEAARLTGQPKAFLRELADAGRLAVRLQAGDGEAKFRVTRSGLAEAGLLPKVDVVIQPGRGELSELIALVREQATRISALEEQRFQLGAQLGVAVERVASLEEQVSALVHVGSDEKTIIAIPVDTNGQSPTRLHSLMAIGTKNMRIANGFRTRVVSVRLRLPARTKDDPAQSNS